MPIGFTWEGAAHPWPAFLCLLISFSPSMIHCMIFWFFSASSVAPGTSVLVVFPQSAFLAFLLEGPPAFPLQNQDLGLPWPFTVLLPSVPHTHMKGYCALL